jgi:hypothetical protein
MSEHLSTFLQIDLQNLYIPKKIEYEAFSPEYKTVPFAKRSRTREETFNKGPFVQNRTYDEKVTPKIDFDKVWEHFNNRESESVNKAIIYTLRNPDTDSGRFETKLRQIGFDVSIKNLPKMRRPKENPYKVVSNSIAITIDCLMSLNLFNKLILMTNHGAFADLCKFVRTQGKTVELWCFKDNYDPILEQHADRLCFIDADFCLKKNISVFGFNLGIGNMMDLTDSTNEIG